MDYARAATELRSLRLEFQKEEFERCRRPEYVFRMYSAVKMDHEEGRGPLLVRYGRPVLPPPNANMSFP